MIYLLIVLLVGVLSGATASIAGFGIGSLMTPLLATRVSVPLAVAAVAIPHAIATALRFVRLRRFVSWKVMRTFGVLSAIGGLAGALLYARFSSRSLTIVLAVLLLATSIAALTDWTSRVRAKGLTAGILGVLSGFFGGIAGNQGGLRAAALLAFALNPTAYVATSTAVGLAVDAARMPIYVWRAGSGIADLAAPITAATIGVVIGTLLGERVLFGLSPRRFQRLIGLLVGALGVWLIVQFLL